jgi:molybdenum cofactor cytidylyltransferase
MRTFGLIPAAGKSARMGQPKLLLPLGGQTVLERVLTAVWTGGVADVLVVVGPGDGALRDVGQRAGADVLQLEEETADMRQTCQRGLDWLAARFNPGMEDGWLLLPADHPTSRPEVIAALLETARQQTDRSIVVPTYQGKRGHPVWLGWAHAVAIRGLPVCQGLNGFIRSMADQTLELPWPGAEILRDLDTPEDYRQLLAETNGS